MRKSILKGGITMIAVLVSTISFGQALEEQLTEIMNFWPGTYNNDKQIATAKKAGKDIWMVDDSGKGGFLQITSHYIKLDRPDLGEHVLYVEEYRDHDPKNAYRQRIYTVSIDKEANMIKVKMWPFKDKKKYLGSFNDITMLKDLKKEEISAYPDFCDMHVKKDGDAYHMYMNDKDCAFGDKYFSYQVKLTHNMFSYRDKITELSTNKRLTTAADFAYHNLDKIE
ncbi:CpcT/CpeT family chromophore lyase [Spongiivirga sp. MCCC 1A20706]|uniref:CpcT/CpeT family chromophore lyase n=1 Tax=Spongiivirga sp. MCCC 1A20706 TaxID=3160963 RepID=UPI00397742F8